MTMNKRNVLIVDEGQTIIGIQGANKGRYSPYYGSGRITAIERLEKADEIVTYGGNLRDIKAINALSQKLRNTEFKMSGVHTDMKDLIWPNIRGSCLTDTFERFVKLVRSVPVSYEEGNQSDVYMTLMLWRHWKEHGEFNDL